VYFFATTTGDRLAELKNNNHLLKEYCIPTVFIEWVDDPLPAGTYSPEVMKPPETPESRTKLEAIQAEARKWKDRCKRQEKELEERSEQITAKCRIIGELDDELHMRLQTIDRMKVARKNLIGNTTRRHKEQRTRIAELETLVDHMDELHDSHDDLDRELEQARECARMEAQRALDFQKELEDAPMTEMDVEAVSVECHFKENVAVSSYRWTAFQTLVRWGAGAYMANQLAWLAYQVT
jgi:hypothetical protein